jgi:hypothetical protein
MAAGLQEGMQILKLSEAAAQRHCCRCVEGEATHPATASAGRLSATNAAGVSAAILDPSDGAAGSSTSGLAGAKDDALPTLEGLGDDPWAEIQDKIRRQGGVVPGGDSRTRQLRQECFVLLKDIVAPTRGKTD